MNAISLKASSSLRNFSPKPEKRGEKSRESSEGDFQARIHDSLASRSFWVTPTLVLSDYSSLLFPTINVPFLFEWMLLRHHSSLYFVSAWIFLPSLRVWVVTARVVNQPPGRMTTWEDSSPALGFRDSIHVQNNKRSELERGYPSVFHH